MNPQPTLASIALLYARLILGVLFVYAGWMKIAGEFKQGFGSFYRGPFKGMQPWFLPDILAAPYGYALPWIELIVGIMLILGIVGTITGVLVTLVLLSIIIAQLVGGMLVQGQPNFTEKGLFTNNLFLLALAGLLAAFGAGKFSLDRLVFKRPT